MAQERAASEACCTIPRAEPAAQAQTYAESVLHLFGGSTDGSNPYAGPLLRDAQGNLYGTTDFGGELTCNSGGSPGCGVVFKLDTTGNETVLHAFTSTPDGAFPLAALVQDTQGDLYGTTANGGVYGVGTVFKVDTAGNETVLYSFTGANGDGAAPFGGLVRDAQGNLYGTTSAGGDVALGCAGAGGCGTVFKVNSAGKETVLYSFTWTNGDGIAPVRRFSAERTGEPVWHYSRGRRLRLWHGIQGGRERQRNRPL